MGADPGSIQAKAREETDMQQREGWCLGRDREGTESTLVLPLKSPFLADHPVCGLMERK